MTKKFIVITTINPISKSILKFKKIPDYELIIAADQKTPKYLQDGLIFLDIEKQEKLPFKSVKSCPYNAYQRKNIGYLYAMSKNADIIAESDDDNFPLSNWGKNIDFKPSLAKLVLSPKIFNIYSEFTNEKIWPRGFPLENILESREKKIVETNKTKVGIWQGLVNGDPDVDAIYRLTIKKKIEFKNNIPHILSNNVYCPFNSQNTFWHKDFFAYLYLPITISSRLTDILRGYIAQRCLWEHNSHLGFTGPTVFQDRNIHELIEDFESEIPCYVLAKKIISILENISLSNTSSKNLITIYTKFIKHQIVEKEELPSLHNWIDDITSLQFL